MRCGELDRKRNPVELLANGGDDRGISIAEGKLPERCGRAFDEQLNRRKEKRFLRADVGDGRRAVERGSR